MKMLRFKLILWTVVILGLGALCLSAAGYKQKANVDGIKVKLESADNGEHFLTEADLLRQIHMIIGETEVQKIRDVETRIVEASLKQNPFIKSVEAYVSGNNLLKVKVEQRKPLYRCFDRAGGTYYIDSEGAKMPVSPRYTARVPVATGVSPMKTDRIEESDVQGRHMFQTIQALKDDVFLDALVEQLYQEANGEIALVPKLNDAVIMLGGPDDLEDKLEKLKVFYREVLPEEGWESFSTIDLRYRGQVVCKRKTRP